MHVNVFCHENCKKSLKQGKSSITQTDNFASGHSEWEYLHKPTSSKAEKPGRPFLRLSDWSNNCCLFTEESAMGWVANGRHRGDWGRSEYQKTVNYITISLSCQSHQATVSRGCVATSMGWNLTIGLAGQERWQFFKRLILIRLWGAHMSWSGHGRSQVSRLVTKIPALLVTRPRPGDCVTPSSETRR